MNYLNVFKCLRLGTLWEHSLNYFQFNYSALSAMDVYLRYQTLKGRLKMKKKLTINFMAVLTHHNDDVTCIPLFCREYHANKLAYVLGRTASRSCFKKVEILGFDDFCKNEDLTRRYLRDVFNNLLIASEV